MKNKVFILALCLALICSSLTVYAEESESEMSLEDINSEIAILESELQDLYDMRNQIESENEPSDTNENNSHTFVPTDDEYVKLINFWDSPHGSHIVTYRITNPNDYPIYFKINTVFKNSDGDAIGTDDDYVRCLGPGEDFILYSHNEDPFESVTYTKNIESRANLESASDYMTYSNVEGTNKLTFTVTNTVSKPVNYAKIEVLYFKDGAPVNFFSSYVSDGTGGTISANGTAYEEVYYSPDYDSYQVFLSGYYE